MFAGTRTAWCVHCGVMEVSLIIGYDQRLTHSTKINIHSHVRFKTTARDQNLASRRSGCFREGNRRRGAGYPAEQHTPKKQPGKKKESLRAFLRVDHIPSSFKPRIGSPGEGVLETWRQSCPLSAALSIAAVKRSFR